jgi:selenide,water dikinase
MLTGSRVSARLDVSAVPVLEEVWPLARAGVCPGGTTRNLQRFDRWVRWPDGLPDETKLVLADAQTSGGLLIAIAPHDLDQLVTRLAAAEGTLAAVIGRTVEGQPAMIQLD